jgi:hypothetical protein
MLLSADLGTTKSMPVRGMTRSGEIKCQDEGPDYLHGGPGEDFFDGGTGGDEIHAIDGEADVILPGPGDSFFYDENDRFAPWQVGIEQLASAISNALRY